jgi:hypothetical protein
LSTYFAEFESALPDTAMSKNSRCSTRLRGIVAKYNFITKYSQVQGIISAMQRPKTGLRGDVTNYMSSVCSSPHDLGLFQVQVYCRRQLPCVLINKNRLILLKVGDHVRGLTES